MEYTKKMVTRLTRDIEKEMVFLQMVSRFDDSSKGLKSKEAYTIA